MVPMQPVQTIGTIGTMTAAPVQTVVPTIQTIAAPVQYADVSIRGGISAPAKKKEDHHQVVHVKHKYVHAEKLKEVEVPIVQTEDYIEHIGAVFIEEEYVEKHG